MSKLRLKNLLGSQLIAHPIIRQALTHRSAGMPHNERLEFLGDAVLSMLIAEVLYHELSDLSEGGLSRMRAHLVQKITLAAIAKETGLAELIHVGKGEIKSSGYERSSILADAFEAVIGAVYLIKGKKAVKRLVQQVFASRLVDLPAVEEIKDAKSKLQEALQARGLNLPVYQRAKSEKSMIKVICKVAEGNIQTIGESSSKRKAEQEAASAALKQFFANNQ